jgi:glycosyltransferase involved in cell wall biosynthesis
MKVGIAAPVTLSLLTPHLDGQPEVGDGYAFAPMARWILGLRDRGHEVSVFTLSPDCQEPQSYSGPGLSVHVAPYRRNGRARDAFLAERQHLAQLMRLNPQEVWHAHWTYEFALAALAISRRIVVTAHDSPFDVLRYHPSPYRAVRLGMAAQVARQAPVLSAVSPYIAQRLSRGFGRRHLPIVPNGVPSEVLSQPAAAPGRPGPVTFASSMMGFGGIKNGRVLLEAFAQVQRGHPQVRLLAFGDGYEAGGEAEQYARHLGLVSGIEFAGRVPYTELLRRLREEAHVLVHSSLEESFGMAIAEAMGLGLPVIAGEKSGAVPWVTANGWAARLVDVRDSGAVAAAMLRLERSAGERELLGLLARRFIADHFSLRRQLEGYEELYERVKKP